MTRPILVAALLSLIGGSLSAQNSQPLQYEATWESLKSRPYPQWFNDAKLGIFIHWGVYSVPAWSGKEQYAEWFLRGLQSGDSARIAFQKRAFGEDFDYRDYASLFKAELFDADEWAELFEKSGAGYVILVSKHHDGYCLWPSQYAPGWNSVDTGPKRDLVGELTDAVRKTKVRMGLYYSLPEWNNPLFRWYTDPHDEIGPYIEKHMIPQFKELISTYKPEVLFADGEWFHTAETWQARELIAWYYNLVGEDAIVNNRWGHGSDIGFLTPEYSAGLEIKDRPWAECRGIGRSFGLNRNEALDAYMTQTELIHFFVKAVSNGGGITLNVGPAADGQIPLLQQERLLQLGKWLQVNGEAIYGARASRRTGEVKRYALRRVDPEVNFDWVRNSPGDAIAEHDFKAVWTGYIQPKFSERYQLHAEADDGVAIWIDKKRILSAAKAGEGQELDSEAILLEAGKRYAIKVAFYENKHQAVMKLSWSSASQPKEIIPQSALFSGNHANVGDGLQAEYSSTGRSVCYTVNNDALYAIALEWPESELALTIPQPPQIAKISLLGRDGYLNWRYADGKLYVDLSAIRYHEMPGHSAWTFKISGLPESQL